MEDELKNKETEVAQKEAALPLLWKVHYGFLLMIKVDSHKK